jgi:2'-5' RNA ligase
MPRLFFGIWPDDNAAEELAAQAAHLARKLGGKAVPREKIHLTLAFLGKVADDRVAEAMLVRARMPAIPLSTDFVGSFRGARVAWAGIEPAPEPLETLYHLLSAELAERGFALEDRRFVPHLTLVRKIERLQPRSPIEPIRWTARAVQLMRSELGTGRYARLGGWRLR